ncbi:MAG: hypothetical protein U0324_34505 [Polyangiales bacterium]
MKRRSLRHDREGLSTTEYVILLVVIACVSIAGWRLLGTSAYSRATSASGDMGSLGSSIDGPAGRGGSGGGGSAGGGGAQGAGAPRSRLEDATADATPPPDPKDELVLPFSLLGGALLLLIAMVVSRRNNKGGGGSGGGEQKSG